MKRYRPLLLIFITLTFHCSPKYTQAPKLIKDSLVFIYPSEAREQHLEGTVVLKVLISENGTVEDAEVDRSSGYDILDQTALNVARTARFKPAKIGGKKRSVWITWPLVFEISSMEFMPEEWVRKALDYQWEATSSSDVKRELAIQALYYHYKDYSRYLLKHRRLFLNEPMLRVVSPQVRKMWSDYQNSWPLTFLLFLDFTERYPRSQFYSEAVDYLIEYMKNELFQIRESTDVSSLSPKKRIKLYNQILDFLKGNYSYSVTDDLLKKEPDH